MPTTRGVYYGDEIYQSPYCINHEGYRLYFSSKYRMETFKSRYRKALNKIEYQVDKIKHIKKYELNLESLLLDVYGGVEPTTKPIKEV